MAKKTSYQGSWENDFSWLKRSSTPGNASCVICKKTNINYESMGRSALTSHEKSKKHQECMKNFKSTVPIQTWFHKNKSHETPPSASNIPQETLSLDKPSTSKSGISPNIQLDLPQVEPSAQEIPSMTTNLLPVSTGLHTSKNRWWITKDNVTRAEILWCAHVVMTHQSLRSAEAGVHVMKIMFPECEVAQDLKLGKDKVSYFIAYGLSPYFRTNLLKNINFSDQIVVGFDESLNKFSQKQQLDIVVRFWDRNTDEVSTRYVSSVFLRESKAEDLLNALKEGIKGLDLMKIIQVSMDGPNVNVKLLRMLKKELEESSENRKLLDIGSCGLHVMNVAFKTGFLQTGWNLITFLRSCYYLFKDSPSRRGLYIKVTKSCNFPLKFCGVRWLENASVAKRALEIMENLEKYIQHVQNDKTQKTTQESKSFKCIKKCLEDKLLRAKLAFFVSLAEDLEPFLRQYQSDSPLVPFIYGDMLAIVRISMEKIVKEEVINNESLTSIDLNENENLKPAKNIDLGYTTKSALRKCKNVKDLEILKLKQDCKLCLIAFLKKLLEKSPLKYELTKTLTFLDPKEIRESNITAATNNMTKTLETLVESNIVSASCAQKADREFKALIGDATILLEMKEYSRKTRLDSFWNKILKKKNGDNFKQVLKICLSMSHGNSMLERGFSVNGDLVVENLSEECLIAQRLVYDSIQSLGGVDKMLITKEMILAVRNANSLWKEALRDKKEKKDNEERAKGEKRKLVALAKELEEKKKKIAEDAASNLAKIDEEIKTIKKQM